MRWSVGSGRAWSRSMRTNLNKYMANPDIERIYEKYKSNTQYRPAYDTRNSNLQQWSGLTGTKTNAIIPTFTHEGEEGHAIKGYGMISNTQLQQLIAQLVGDMSSMVSQGNFALKSKVDLLKLLLDL